MTFETVKVMQHGRAKKTRRASKRTLVWDAHLEGAAALSYLVSCQAQTGASRPDLVTDMVEYRFLGSWGAWGFQGQESGGSFQAVGAV